MHSRRRQITDAILVRLRASFPSAFVTFAIPSVQAGLFRHDQALMLTWQSQTRRDRLTNRAEKVTTFAVHAWQPWNPEDAEDPAGLVLMDLGDDIEDALMVDERWGGLAFETSCRGQTLTPFEEDGTGVVGLQVVFDVQHFHDLQDTDTFEQLQPDTGVSP